MDDFIAYLFYYLIIGTCVLAWVTIAWATTWEIIEWWKRK
jgi:hypothetical protein